VHLSSYWPKVNFLGCIVLSRSEGESLEPEHQRARPKSLIFSLNSGHNHQPMVDLSVTNLSSHWPKRNYIGWIVGQIAVLCQKGVSGARTAENEA
jgi:hypothetical protein